MTMNTFFTKMMVFFICLYQRVLSPDHSFWSKKIFPHGYCPFYPTCSEYGKQAVLKKGIIIGLLFAGWRIMRCHPWTDGGIDFP